MRRALFTVLLAAAFTHTPPAAASPPSASRPTGRVEGAWSPVVDGVRARLVSVLATDSAGRATTELELDIDNTTGKPRTMAWGTFSQLLDLSLEDTAGHPMPRIFPGGNELAAPPAPKTLVPGNNHFVVAPASYEYVPGGKVLFRPFAFVAWELPSPTPALVLRGTLVSFPGSPPREVKGPLPLSRIRV